MLLALPTGWPTALVAAALLAGLLLVAALVAWRGGFLLKLGLRNIPRRPARAALIVCGLALSTTVFASALGTGDTMGYTVRSLVTQSLGPVDEMVVLNPPRDSLARQARALANPGLNGLAGGDLGFFAEYHADRLGQATAGSDAIAAVAPAIVAQVSVVQPRTRQVQSSVSLIAVPWPYPAAFGTPRALDGSPVPLERLGRDDVLLNQAAAQQLEVAAGQPLEIVPHSDPWKVRVGAVIRDGGLGGRQATIVVPLPRYQQVTLLESSINAILVANPGGVESAARTDAAAQALRLPLADQSAAQELHDFLAAPPMQKALRTAAGTLRGDARARIEELRAEAAKPAMTAEFVSQVTDPRTRADLFGLAHAVPASSRGSIYGALNDVTRLSVVPVKQSALDQANQFGAVVSTVFVALGIFSVAAATILIFLIFALLAADRTADLGTLRALGMSRRQIATMFLFEGLVYDLAGALLGILLGLGASLVTTVSLARSLSAFGLRVDWHVEPRSLAIAFAAGMLLTFAAMIAAAWRVSRTGIATATRGDLGEEDGAWRLVPGALLLLVAALVWRRWQAPVDLWEPRHPLVLPGALSLALLGAAFVLAGVVGLIRRIRPHPRTPSPNPVRGGTATPLRGVVEVGTVLLALGVIGVWARTLARMPTPGGEIAHDATTIAVGGVVLALVGTWLVSRLLGPLARLLDQGLILAARLRALVRPAAGALDRQRGRAAMAILMFGMVVLTMVTALTMIYALVGAYGGHEPAIAGFDIRADRGAGKPVADIERALHAAPAVRRDAFGAVGSMTMRDVQVVQLGLPRADWAGATMAVVDDGFLQGIRATIDHHVAGSDTERVWSTLRTHPGTTVVTASLLNQGVTLPGGSESPGMPPLTIWVRSPDGIQPVRLTVIGVVDSRSALDPGIYTSVDTARAMGLSSKPPDTFVFALQPGVRSRDALQGLRMSFADRGLSFSVLDETLQVGRAVRSLLTQIVQGFMGLGLIAGVAALGLLGLQSVIERRRQLGTLRALGFTRWQTRLSLAFESTVIASAGIGLGVVIGLALARSLVAMLAHAYPEIEYVVPWSQIALTAAVAWLGATLAIVAALWQAGRVSPAEALRAG